jgi:hypothetical protein
MTDDAVNLTLKRIISVNWQLDWARAPSHLRLVKEHFRRMALWAEALNCIEKWPFFDVAAHITPSLRAPEDKVEILGNYLKQLNVGHYMKAECICALHWAAAQGSPEVSNYLLPPPYEPVLILYERGGTFHKEDGFLIRISDRLGFSQGKLSDYDRLSPALVLDADTLDQADIDWNNRHP